jgi:hypothetical protein
MVARQTKGEGRFLPTRKPKELREVECPLVVENGIDKLEIFRTDPTS